MIKKIIFDLDGTLLFISDEWIDGYQKFIDKYNLSITPNELYVCIGDFEKDINNVIVNNKLMCEYINSKLDVNITESMFKELLEIYKDIPLLYTEVVYDVLNYLYNKYEIISYTNWYTQNQIDRLKKNNLDKFFSKIYGWDKVQIKPSREAINKIIENDDIKEYVMIGDNIALDLEVPYSMGMNTIFLNTKNVEQNKFKQIQKIEELKEIL